MSMNGKRFLFSPLGCFATEEKSRMKPIRRVGLSTTDGLQRLNENFDRNWRQKRTLVVGK